MSDPHKKEALSELARGLSANELRDLARSIRRELHRQAAMLERQKNVEFTKKDARKVRVLG